jgi:23S rRNA (uracil1939-C5)-methyltransferase
MTAMFAKVAKKAIGIEIVPEAVKAANELKELNGLSDKMQNICAPCEEVLPNIIESEKLSNANVSVVLDPPRKGCDNKVLSAILKAMPDKIVYVACSPQSLARDVGILVGSLGWVDGELKRVEDYIPNYKIESVTPYNMFSKTKHVETVVCLARKA